jgi:phosphoglycolate phosphatase
VKAAYLATYSHKQHDKTKPYPGIEKLLADLIQANISINVLSNKPDHDTQTVIQYFFPKTAFTFVYGKKPGYPIKPDPCSVNEIIGKLGFSRSEILYVGDTFTDMMTAKNADLTSVGVLWGFRKVEELKRGGAHFII